MKYVRFKTKEGVTCYGILESDEKIRAIDGTPFEELKLSNDYYKTEEVDLLAPTEYSKAICIGLNYRDHAEEFGLPIPESPVVFMKPSTCAIGQGENVVYPSMCSI